MNNWKSASEMQSYTRQNIEARDTIVNREMPYYMNRIMECIIDCADNYKYTCTFEFYPEKGEDMEFFDQIVSAVRKKLKSLGYLVMNNQTRFGVKVSWAFEEIKYTRV